MAFVAVGLSCLILSFCDLIRISNEMFNEHEANETNNEEEENVQIFLWGEWSFTELFYSYGMYLIYLKVLNLQ